MAFLSALFLKVFHKGELAVFDIQEWIIFHSQKFFLEDGKKGYHGEDGNKNTLSSITVQDYWNEFCCSARSWQRETMNITEKS